MSRLSWCAGRGCRGAGGLTRARITLACAEGMSNAGAAQARHDRHTLVLALMPPPPWKRRRTRMSWRVSFPVMKGPGRSGRVQVHHREGKRSSPDSSDLEAICGELPRPGARRRWRDETDMSATGWSRGRRGRARADRPSRPGRHAGSHGREAVTIISAPVGSGKTRRVILRDECDDRGTRHLDAGLDHDGTLRITGHD